MNTGGATVNRGEIVSMYAGLNRNQSYDQAIVRSGVTEALVDDALEGCSYSAEQRQHNVSTAPK